MDDGSNNQVMMERWFMERLRKIGEYKDQEKEDNVNSTNNVNAASTNEVNVVGEKPSIELLVDQNMPALEDISIFDFTRDDEDDDFVVGSMDVKMCLSLCKGLEEEVYVCQPPGFEDPDFPDREYKVEKALYGLHQAPRAWYETLSTYLLDNGFQRGKIDKTLFIKRFIEVKTASTPLETQKPLLKDEDGEEVDVHMYRSMIGTLMYLTSSRPDIMFAMCACARYQVNPKVSHLHDVKRIFSSKTTAWNDFSSTMASAIICLATNQKFNFSKYIFESMVKNLDNVGKFLMYPRFVQVFVNQQLEGMPTHKRIYVTPSHTKKIFGNMKRVGKGFSGRVTPLFPTMVVHNQEEMGEGLTNPTDPYHTPTIIQPSTSQPQKTQKPKRPKRKDTKVSQPSGPTTNVADKAVNEEMDNSLVRAATSASSLESEQDSGNIDKTQSKATPNEPSSPGTSSGGGPKRQETMGDIIAQTRSENISKLSNDPLLARVLNLETTKTTQANEIASLKRRVKKLEQKKRSRTHGLKRLYKVGSSRRVESSRDEEDLVNDDNEMFDVGTLTGDEVMAEQVVAAKDGNLSIDEVTLGQALAALKSEKVQEKGDVIEKPSVPVSAVSASTKDSAATTTTATIPTLRKGIVFQEPEPEKPMKKKELIRLDEEIASKLQAEFDEEVRLARERAKKEQEANVALNEEWDDIQAKIEADQARRVMFDRAFKRVNTFVDFRTDLVEGEIVEVDDNQEAAKIKELIEIIPNKEEVAIDAIPLATKPPSIIDWKIHKEGKKTYYQIIRADGSSKMYLVLSHMLKSFDREDLETLWKLVKAKHGSTRLEEGYERVLWGDLKTMFDPHVEDIVWRNQQDYRVLDWKIYDTWDNTRIMPFLGPFFVNSSILISTISQFG
ncbi:ribonuclease H-like domain-containing protein [Tanacetum coccineum]